MIHYQTGTWGIAFIWRFHGSVFPRGVAWAIPAAVLSASICPFVEEWRVSDWKPSEDQLKNGMLIWSGYNFVLGFLLVFRTQQAYSRFWEGSTLLQEVRGEWFNAVSSLVAFSTRQQAKQTEVREFQHLLVRLMSMLYCTALQLVHREADETTPVCFEIIDPEGISPDALQFLDEVGEQADVLLQWIQRLIVECMENGVLPVPPPVLSRAFQELSRGVVHLHNARKIADIPFPFPYAQMLTVLLIIHWIITPVFASLLIEKPVGAFVFSFIAVFAYWSIQYIAAEIEHPFGNDENDLPLLEHMEDMNASLSTLLDPRAQNPPSFHGELAVADTLPRLPLRKLIDLQGGERPAFDKLIQKRRSSQRHPHLCVTESQPVGKRGVTESQPIGSQPIGKSGVTESQSIGSQPTGRTKLSPRSLQISASTVQASVIGQVAPGKLGLPKITGLEGEGCQAGATPHQSPIASGPTELKDTGMSGGKRTELCFSDDVLVKLSTRIEVQLVLIVRKLDGFIGMMSNLPLALPQNRPATSRPQNPPLTDSKQETASSSITDATKVKRRKKKQSGPSTTAKGSVFQAADAEAADESSPLLQDAELAATPGESLLSDSDYEAPHAQDCWIGKWHYGENDSYVITRSGGGLEFEQKESDASTVGGSLVAHGKWLVATLRRSKGDLCGTIRLRYQEGKIASNFKATEAAAWGDTVMATLQALVPCMSRWPNVGDEVVSVEWDSLKSVLEDRQGNKDSWELLPGEIATVVEVDKDGDFRLRNPHGLESCATFRKDYGYVSQGDGGASSNRHAPLATLGH